MRQKRRGGGKFLCFLFMYLFFIFLKFFLREEGMYLTLICIVKSCGSVTNKNKKLLGQILLISVPFLFLNVFFLIFILAFLL